MIGFYLHTMIKKYKLFIADVRQYKIQLGYGEGYNKKQRKKSDSSKVNF